MKKDEATQKTTAELLKTARKHFTLHGYYDVSLEKIAEECNVTRGAVYHHFKNKKGLFLAVLDMVQKDVALHIETEAMKSDDPWQQLIGGCLGFVKGSNAKECRRILLVDAPAVVGWDEWRTADKENSMGVLQEHIVDLHTQGYLQPDVDTQLMTYSLSGALNELALQYSSYKTAQSGEAIVATITKMVSGFKIINPTKLLPTN